MTPLPGQVYQRALGVEWRVISAGPATVDYEVVATGERHSVSLVHWQRLERRGFLKASSVVVVATE